MFNSLNQFEDSLAGEALGPLTCTLRADNGQPSLSPRKDLDDAAAIVSGRMHTICSRD